VAALVVQDPGPSSPCRLASAFRSAFLSAFRSATCCSGRSRQVWPWWAAIIFALLVCAAIGAIHGIIITRLRLPSFVVTLADRCSGSGHDHYLGNAGGLSVTSTVQGSQQPYLYGIVYAYLDPVLSWIVLR